MDWYLSSILDSMYTFSHQESPSQVQLQAENLNNNS